MYFSGKDDRHEQAVGFLVHLDIMKTTVIGCHPISSREILDSVAERSTFNIYAYVPTSSYDDSVVDELYSKHQFLVDQTPKQDIMLVQGDWNAKVGEDAHEDWGRNLWTFLQSFSH